MSDDRFTKKKWEPADLSDQPEDQKRAVAAVHEVFGPGSHVDCSTPIDEKFEVILDRDKMTLKAFLFKEFDEGRAKSDHVQILSQLFKGKIDFRALYIEWMEEKKK